MKICKKMLISRKGLLITMLLTLVVGSGYAISSLQFKQTLTIPDSDIEVYTSSSLSAKLSSGADLTNRWSWDGNAFTLTLYVKNVGQSTVTVDVTADTLPSGWQILASSITLSSGSNKPITVVVTPPSKSAGVTSGQWSFTLETI